MMFFTPVNAPTRLIVPVPVGLSVVLFPLDPEDKEEISFSPVDEGKIFPNDRTEKPKEEEEREEEVSEEFSLFLFFIICLSLLEEEKREEEEEKMTRLVLSVSGQSVKSNQQLPGRGIFLATEIPMG